MFTGLVESTATVLSFTPRLGGARLVLETPAVVREVALGDSIAINGCCLTVAEISEGALSFDLLEETLRVTNLGTLQAGAVVNVERALRAGARLGGHYVQGHVDATLEVLAWEPCGADWRFTVELPLNARGLVIPKGSICLDGISLTAAEVTDQSITCFIIPHTREVTHLQHLLAGQRVNVEWDMMGKYVRELVRAELARARSETGHYL
jgi:riboflavin synthase